MVTARIVTTRLELPPGRKLSFKECGPRERMFCQKQPEERQSKEVTGARGN